MRPKPPVKSASPYRSFLTPALHRRFMRACVWSFGASGLYALFIGASLPLSLLGLIKTTVLTLLVFISSLFVYFIRISNVQVGSSTTASPLIALRKSLLTAAPYTTAVFYIASSLLFGEISIWWASTESRLSLVDKSGVNARAHLNERPLYYLSLFFNLGLIQIAYHLAKDLDRVEFPIEKTDATIDATPPFLNHKTVGLLAAKSLSKSFLAAIIGTIGYKFIYRTLLWEWAFNLLDYLYSFPKNSYNRRNYHYDLGGLFVRFLFAGFFLCLLWDFTNDLFSYYIVEAPLKKGKPLTDDSKDQNGSLINGLKDKRHFRQSMAFWELALISKQFPARRQALYSDFERPDGSAWSLLLEIWLAELSEINMRIKAYTDGSLPPKPKGPVTSIQPDVQIDVKPAKPEGIYATSADRSMGGLIKSAAQYIGENPGAKIPPVQLVKYGAKRVVDEEYMSRQSGNLQVRVESTLTSLLQWKPAVPFQESFRRRANAVVCGSPSSRTSIIVDAISSASNFAIHSIAEDTPGQVQKDVGRLARMMVDSQIAIQSFVGFKLKPHWTDVQFREVDRRRVEEVNEIISALKTGVKGILDAFEGYLGDVGISAAEAKAWGKLLGSDGRPVTPT